MLKRIVFTLVFLASACVTVNIYFPAAAVERAADQIVKETWGGPNAPAKPAPPPQSRNLFAPSYFASLSIISEAFAQDADINVSNPAIRALKEFMKKRSEVLKPYLDKGNVGIGEDGLLTLRSADGLNLKERADVNQLIEAENKDREALYAEIAKANNMPRDNIPKIKSIFAKSWIEQARPGWWIQSGGSWQKK